MFMFYIQMARHLETKCNEYQMTCPMHTQSDCHFQVYIMSAVHPIISRCITLQKCKGQPSLGYLSCICSEGSTVSMYKGHFNPSWVLSVADVTIIAQLANLN